MAGRYAAAHARREQRRSQPGTRDFLPLAETVQHEAVLGATGVTGATINRATARLAPMDYGYLKADLRRIGLLAVSLFALLIVLAFVINR